MLESRHGEMRTKRDVILTSWENLDYPSVGATELEQIQSELRRIFDGAGLDSPASIARVLADEGAELRHPEVLEFDTRWREQALSTPPLLEFGSLAQALESMSLLCQVREEFLNSSNEPGLSDLRAYVLAAREDSVLRSRSPIIGERERSEAKEVASWLTVWVNTPDLFPDWLELRRVSTQFQREFGEP